jgi:pimeloyl-ACP methyl ester carboxylesterase
MLHGLAEGSFVYYPFVERVSAHFRTILIDLRGHGLSEWDKEQHYSLQDYADDIQIVLRELNLDDYFLVGHSLGGDVVAKVAGNLTGLLGIVLIDTGPIPESEINIFLYEQIVGNYRTFSSVREYVDTFAGEPKGVERNELVAIAQHALVQTDSGLKLRFDVAVCESLLKNRDTIWWWPALKNIPIPTLVIRGRASAALSVDLARDMVKHLRHGALVTIDRAGHSVMSDNPTQFINSVLGFTLQIASLNNINAMERLIL